MRDAREKRRRFFFFLGKDWRVVALFWLEVEVGSSYCGLGVQAPPRKTVRSCGTAWKNPAYMGLILFPAYPAYRPQIPMWERRAGETDGCLLSPHFVYIVYHKIWRLSKMESGRKWKGWKILEGAGLREMDTREGVRGKEWKGGQVVAT